jgi:Tfp pilus assembly protein PilF
MLFLPVSAWQQQKPVEPPEEDLDVREKEYAFNPLQAAREITVGNFYFKKGNYRAAATRYEEAVKWDPANGDAYLKLAGAYEKVSEKERAREVLAKFIEMVPDHKRVPEIRRKLGKTK